MLGMLSGNFLHLSLMDAPICLEPVQMQDHPIALNEKIALTVEKEEILACDFPRLQTGMRN
jgi:hypothetical protein